MPSAACPGRARNEPAHRTGPGGRARVPVDRARCGGDLPCAQPASGPGPQANANLALLWLRNPARADVTLTQARAVSFGIGRLEFITR